MEWNTKVAAPDELAIQQAAELLQKGELVGLPTETVYGLAANAYADSAVAKIFRAKGRPQDNPLIVHIAKLGQLADVANDIPPAAYRLAQAFWPGPLTIILPKGEKIASSVSAGLDTVAVRMPSHPVAKKVLEACGLPLAAPSANLSGAPSPTEAAYVLADMKGKIPLILDGGSCTVGVESTVISLTGGQPVLLRPGLITPEQLEQTLNCKIALSTAILDKLEVGEKAQSPGMKYKHYAPKANVIIVEGGRDAYCSFVNTKKAEGVMALCFTEDEPLLDVPVVLYGRGEDAPAQARLLFTALRELDEAKAVTVYAHAPKKEGVALAVYNRLLRAAAFQVVKL